MSYEKQTWKNNDPKTPLSASRLNHMEEGIEAASSVGGMSLIEDPPGSGLYRIEGAA